MEHQNKLVVFGNTKIRRVWHKTEWYFSVVGVVGALTDSVNPRDYWFKMKTRVKTEEGLELSTICRQFKLKAPDGKMRETEKEIGRSVSTRENYLDKDNPKGKLS